jgi:hypothetical protein
MPREDKRSIASEVCELKSRVGSLRSKKKETTQSLHAKSRREQESQLIIMGHTLRVTTDIEFLPIAENLRPDTQKSPLKSRSHPLPFLRACYSLISRWFRWFNQ